MDVFISLRNKFNEFASFQIFNMNLKLFCFLIIVLVGMFDYGNTQTVNEKCDKKCDRCIHEGSVYVSGVFDKLGHRYAKTIKMAKRMQAKANSIIQVSAKTSYFNYNSYCFRNV